MAKAKSVVVRFRLFVIEAQSQAKADRFLKKLNILCDEADGVKVGFRYDKEG
jgi:hypothetical protein